MVVNSQYNDQQLPFWLILNQWFGHSSWCGKTWFKKKWLTSLLEKKFNYYDFKNVTCYCVKVYINYFQENVIFTSFNSFQAYSWMFQ
jgi:hypothetical protein